MSKYQKRSKVIWRGKRYQQGRRGSNSRVSKIRRRWFALIASFVFLISGFSLAASYFIFSDRFQIKNIQIEGVKNVPSDEVSDVISEFLYKEKFALFSGSNYFALNESALSEILLKKFPRIGKVDAKKGFPDELRVLISEREAAGIWCADRSEKTLFAREISSDNCFYIDEFGVIFDKAPKSSGAIVFSISDFRDKGFALGDAVFTPDSVASFQNINQIISKNFPFGIRQFSITGRGEFEILTTEGWKIFFGEKIDEEYQFSNLKYVLDNKIGSSRKNLEYIDLRLGNKVYYKFRI